MATHTSGPMLLLDERQAGEVMSALRPVVADLLELRNQIKTAHWNLVGEGFLSIHRFLDEIYETVSNSADEVAERISQVGGIVDGSANAIGEFSSLPALPIKKLPVPEAISKISIALRTTVLGIREAMNTLDKEPITVDLLTKISGQLEVQLWLLSSNIT